MLQSKLLKRQLSWPLWELRATPQRRKDKVHSWDDNQGVSVTAREGVWQGAITWGEAVKCSAMNTIRTRDVQTQASPLQTHFSTHSISTQFNLLTIGCLPDMVQFGGCSLCPSGGRQTETNEYIKYTVCQLLGSKMKKIKDGERIKKYWKRVHF